jgi:SAM-dependent methyltransferase
MALYDRIGRDYNGACGTEPRIARHIWDALGDAHTVLNVGAGSGSYEPPDREVVAVEPSAAMRAQRPPSAPLCIDAEAESLPFEDGAFDAAMAVLSDHHWRNPIAGLRELTRVARRVVVFQWDDREIPRFWLVRDYLPEFAGLATGRPGLAARAAAIGAEQRRVPIPWDCVDGFFHCFWRRPEAYLREPVRRGSSVWARLGPVVERRAVDALTADLRSGAWHARNAELLELPEADLGARLLVQLLTDQLDLIGDQRLVLSELD